MNPQPPPARNALGRLKNFQTAFCFPHPEERTNMPIETGTSAAYLYSIGGIGIVGTLFGMPLDALILGGLAGTVAH